MASSESTLSEATVHDDEPNVFGRVSKSNWRRVGALGANDGIMSVAGIVVGVAGATSAKGPMFPAGLASPVAGAVRMVLEEYVFLSSQRDSDHAALRQEKRELESDPDSEMEELSAIYEAKSLGSATARTVAQELTAHDALAAHVDAELNLDPEDIARPWGGSGSLRPVVHRGGHPASGRDSRAAAGPAGAGDPLRCARSTRRCRRVKRSDRGESREQVSAARGRGRRSGSGPHLRRGPSLWHGYRVGEASYAGGLDREQEDA